MPETHTLTQNSVPPREPKPSHPRTQNNAAPHLRPRDTHPSPISPAHPHLLKIPPNNKPTKKTPAQRPLAASSSPQYSRLAHKQVETRPKTPTLQTRCRGQSTSLSYPNVTKLLTLSSCLKLCLCLVDSRPLDDPTSSQNEADTVQIQSALALPFRGWHLRKQREEERGITQSRLAGSVASRSPEVFPALSLKCIYEHHDCLLVFSVDAPL